MVTVEVMWKYYLICVDIFFKILWNLFVEVMLKHLQNITLSNHIGKFQLKYYKVFF